MKPIALTTASFKEQTASGVTVVDFWASWCGPCRMLSPIVEELAEEMSGVKFAKVNVDEEPMLANEFRVNAIPTLVFMKNGQAVGQTVGLQGKDALKAAIEKIKGA